jgi:hypothetical protein
VIPYPTIE